MDHRFLSYRVAIVHGISTVGKTHVWKDRNLSRRLKANGIDMWDTDAIPQFIYGSFSAVHHLQGPEEPTRSQRAADAFDDLMDLRLEYVRPNSSFMLVVTNNSSIVERWRDLVLCSFVRSKEDVVLARMERESLDRRTATELVHNWQFHLPATLKVPEVVLEKDEFLPRV